LENIPVLGEKQGSAARRILRRLEFHYTSKISVSEERTAPRSIQARGDEDAEAQNFTRI
jgi:hypothetical protein